jgi:hypothetical protein
MGAKTIPLPKRPDAKPDDSPAPISHGELFALLMASDSPDYARISQTTGRPMGSIGPTRQRLLERLRRDPDIRHLMAG